MMQSKEPARGPRLPGLFHGPAEPGQLLMILSASRIIWDPVWGSAVVLCALADLSLTSSHSRPTTVWPVPAGVMLLGSSALALVTRGALDWPIRDLVKALMPRRSFINAARCDTPLFAPQLMLCPCLTIVGAAVWPRSMGWLV